MERIYILDELDCANCAMKIERHVGKIKGVKECSVDFVSKRMFVDMEHEGIEAVLEETVQAIEPDVILRRKDDKKAASAESRGQAGKLDIPRQRNTILHRKTAAAKKRIITTMQIVPVHTRMDMITTMPAMGRMHMKTTDTIIMKAVAAGMTMLMKHMRIVKFREHSSCM